MSMKEIIVNGFEQLDCTQPLHPLAIVGLKLFNRQQFFEAHEALETAWRAEKPPGNRLYQGILQIGVAYYHIQKANPRGALKMFMRARKTLSGFPDTCRGVDLRQLQQDAAKVENIVTESVPDCIQSLTTLQFNPVNFIEQKSTAHSK